MQVSDVDRHTLRRLSEVRPDPGRVVSLYLSLDPSEFATPPARATAVRSLLDDAERKARGADGLTHDEQRDLREDLARVREFLEGGALPTGGAHGVAVFASKPAGLFEALRLPSAVDSAVVVDRTPYIEPLAGLATGCTWSVVLVSRRTARLFEGDGHRLAEVTSFREDVHGQHQQGGWSQPRYERSVEKEVEEHLGRAADVLRRRFERDRFDRLLVGGPEEIVPRFEGLLHQTVRDRLAGRVECDVDNTTADAVLECARPVIEADERRREREALDRLAEGLSTGDRAAAGLADVLAALNERRVETLLLSPGLSEPGVVCRRCGWLGAEGVAECPADGGELERREDIVEQAVELALQQSADVLAVRHHDDLAERDDIAALLRF